MDTKEDIRIHQIKSHYGSNDFYRYYSRNGGGLSRGMYGDVLRDLNLLIAEQILCGYSFKMPARMGVLAVTKKKEFVAFKDGKAVTNRPIDFPATLKMWEEHPETKVEKKLVRFLNKHTNGYIYKIAYNRHYATFRNKTVFSFQINRYLKRGLAKKIFAGLELDALVAKPKYSNGNKY